MATMVGLRRHKMLIGSDAVDSDQTYELRSPATGEVFATIAHRARGSCGSSCPGGL
jgi:hypothetical protein